MHRRTGLISLVVFLAAVPVFLVPLMSRSQAIIDRPEPGTAVALSSLAYKANAFEARVTSTTLELTSAADADPVTGQWTFLGSNSDGQMHKVEIFVRPQDESGKQIAMFSGKCLLSGGAHDQPCKVDMKLSAAEWKDTKAVRIVTDWQS